MPGERHFGAPMKRLEDDALLRGQGRFVDDIDLPGAWHAAFVRSPHAHARIRAIDTAAARALPGVHAVLTHADLPQSLRENRIPLRVPNAAIREPRMPFALVRDEVTVAGEGVAVVLAESRYVAEDAAALVDVEYELLPAVADCRTAMMPDAPLAHTGTKDNICARFVQSYGTIATAFERAAHRASVSLWLHRGSGHAIECRACLGQYDAVTDKLTLWVAGQTPHAQRRVNELLFGLDPAQVRVIMPDVGGGFGTKANYFVEQAVIAACAMRFKRPVKWVEDRRENFLTATQERDQYWDMEMALDRDGKILGVRGKLLHDGGAYVPHGIIMPLIASTTVPGPYVVPAYHLEVTVAFTNKPGTAPVRGAGRPQAAFTMERLMDKAARVSGIDPAELRRRNLIPPERMPYPVGLTFRDGRPLVYDSGDYPAVFEKAMSLSAYREFRERQAKARSEGRFIGIGIGAYVEGTGLGPFEGATLRVLPSGKVRLMTGAAPQGQGHRTSFAQIAADHLGVDPASIDVVMADTDAIAMGWGAFASRLAANAGPAIHIAGGRLRDKIRKLAAHVLEAAEEDIELAGGRAHVKGVPQMGKGFGELAEMAAGMSGFALPKDVSPGLEETHYFGPEQAAYCNGTHIAEVEVDVETGHVKILRYVIAHDCGRLINPLIVEGQIQGGLAHGVGNALFEWMGYDGSAQPTTVSLADYLLPGACDVPDAALVHIETPCPLNPLGVKGAGEGGTIPAPAAIVSAIEDALRPFGIEIAEAPVTPMRLRALLAAATKT
ncbi:MAG TPA: xanthine dehydrogenase family protein molybdopterin-binding subunit [Stellaceae bacterium]|nr:xanthine dehydrogenase family protein molybdopterin-binding subunit [Stellaceae bacterium]